jgi:hypothetical protein
LFNIQQLKKRERERIYRSQVIQNWGHRWYALRIEQNLK